MTKYDIAFWNLNGNEKEIDGKIKDGKNKDEKTEALARYATARDMPILTEQDVENPRFEETAFRTAKEYVVYGNENGQLKKAVFGIQKMNRQCYVVKDMVNGISESALEELTKTGAKLIMFKDVLEGKIK